MTSIPTRLLALVALGTAMIAAPIAMAVAADDDAATLATPPAAPPVTANRRVNPERAAVIAALRALVHLTPDQREKIKALTVSHARAAKQVTDRTSPEGREQLRQLFDQYLTDIQAVLGPDQKERFHTVFTRTLAWESPFGVKLETLGLTHPERESIAPLLVVAVDQWHDVRDDPGLRGRARRAKVLTITGDLKSQVRPLLTPPQQTALDALDLAPGRGQRTADATDATAAPGVAPAADDMADDIPEDDGPADNAPGTGGAPPAAPAAVGK